MVAFAVYVAWDAKKNHNNLKLLFLIPIGMSMFLFPPFVTMMSETFFATYRSLLLIVCLAVIMIYFVNVRKRHTAAIRQQQTAKGKKNKQPKNKNK